MNTFKKISQYVLKALVWIPITWLIIFAIFTLLCWNELGHFPVPSLDDPKYIGYPKLQIASVVGLFLTFYSAVLWLISLPFSIKFKLLTKNYILLVSISFFLVMILMLTDPFEVIVWLLD